MGITVAPVSNRRDMKIFLRFPLRLYRRDELFVPPLLHEQKRLFHPRNPIFQFTDAVYLLARNDSGRPVGRVTAHINRRHNERTGEKCGFFGFFECVQCFETATAMMQRAAAILRAKGMETIRGPFSFSTNEECAFLARGFDLPPAIMMTWNRPYYIDYFERMGFRKAKDLLAFEHDSQGVIPEHLVRFGDRLRARLGIEVRPVELRDFDHELSRIFDVYNAAWADNWGFVPMTREQFRYAAAGLKSVVEPALVLLAEKNGEPVGFSFSLPDYNPIIKKMRGRILPFGLVHLLLGRRKLSKIRVIMMGVRPEYRKRGIDTVLYLDTCRNVYSRSFYSSEMSWILEDNRPMVRALERMGAQPTKTYRIFEREL